jgi:electron transport complex protein RnfG
MASKKKSSFANMVLVLLVITGIASTALAYVYQFTKGPIDIAKREKEKKAIEMVVPEFDIIADTMVVAISEGDSLTCFSTMKGDSVTGYAVKANTKKGFSGEFWIMVGFTPDGKIFKTSVLEHKETPGLGDKMQADKADWSLQFNALDVPHIVDNDGDGVLIEVKKDQGTIDAITAATISSRGFCDACERAYKAFLIISGNNTNH